MLEIIALIIAVTGIGSLARGRGKSPVIAGIIAVAGFVIIDVGGIAITPPNEARLAVIVGAWAWIAFVAGYLRFVVGAGKPKPDGKWNCRNCNYLNNASSIVCEACQQPWNAEGSAVLEGGAGK